MEIANENKKKSGFLDFLKPTERRASIEEHLIKPEELLASLNIKGDMKDVKVNNDGSLLIKVARK